MAMLGFAACAKGEPEVGGWRAQQPGVQMRLEAGAGPAGETALIVQYTIIPGRDYAIEFGEDGSGVLGERGLQLQAKATRVLHLALVLVGNEGQQHERVHTLLPNAWQALQFPGRIQAADGWEQVQALRLIDRTGGLGSQGPVTLKLAGLPLQ